MKKIIISFLIICSVICLTGCDALNNVGKDRTKLGGWTLDLNANMLNIPNDALVVYNKAVQNYTEMKLEPIAYLGKQIVSGTNYMYFCKVTAGKTKLYTNYRVVVIYNDLEGNASITSVKTFDIVSYADKSIPPINEETTGGWAINTNMNGAVLDDGIKYSFNNAVSSVSGATYTPIAKLAYKNNGGNDYVILTLTKKGSNNYFNVLTIYEQLDGNSDISSEAYVNLGDFNK